MKVENHSSLMVQWFHHKNKVLLRKERFSWWNLITLHARNATTIIHFIVTAKILTVIRNFFAVTAIINLHPNARGRRGQIAGGNIRLVLCAERQAFCISIMSISLTTDALIKSVITLSLSGNPLPLQRLLCHPCSESITLSVCDILFKLSLPLYLCFISVKILFAISAWSLKRSLISRFLIQRSAIGASNLPLCLMICVFT